MGRGGLFMGMSGMPIMGVGESSYLISYHILDKRWIC